MGIQLRRRDLLKTSAAIVAVQLLPRRTKAASPNSRLRTAHIGIGGAGRGDLKPRLHKQGAYFVGAEGVLMLPHPGEAQLFPQAKFHDVKPPPLAEREHHHQWVDACLGKGETSASFSYAGPLTEALLLGVVANRFPHQTLRWDSDQLQFSNLPAANQLLRRNYRHGFEVAQL